MPALAFDVVAVTLAAAVTTNGTITVPYPAKRTKADYTFGNQHSLSWNGVNLVFPRDFSVSLGASAATLTLVAATTLPAGSTAYVRLDRPGGDAASISRQMSELARLIQNGAHSVSAAMPVLVSMGAPASASNTAVCASQTPGAAGPLVLNGGLVAGGVAVFDVPRNLTVVSGANASGLTVTFTGLDEFGVPLSEAIAGPNNGTTAGKKAFAAVTGASVSGSGFVAISAGTGTVLGLPLALPNAGFILKEVVDGSVVTNGTFVAQDTSTPTTTTGDVRGTYAPNTAPNGSHTYHLLIAAVNIDQGGPQA